MNKIIFGLVFCFLSQYAMAISDYPIVYIACNGFNPTTKKYWKVESKSQGLSQNDEPQVLTVEITNQEGEKAVSKLTRGALAKKYDNIVRLQFFKDDDVSNPLNIEGMLTIENTQNGLVPCLVETRGLGGDLFHATSSAISTEST